MAAQSVSSTAAASTESRVLVIGVDVLLGVNGMGVKRLVGISVVRPSNEDELGLDVEQRDDRMVVTSIAPGIFDGSQLEVGMIIDSVNGSCPLSYKDALHTLQNAEGRINIVALSRV